MKRSLLIALVLLGVLARAAPAAADAASEARYQSLLAAAKSGATSVNWTELRLAYAASDSFDVTGARTKAARTAMFQALSINDDKTAAAQAQAILAIDYVDIDAHVVLDITAEQGGDAVTAKREHAIVVGLLTSVRTGDGLTPEHAFTPITIGEAYAVVRAFSLTPKGQALVRSAGRSYDRIDVVDADGKPMSLYFRVDDILAKAVPPPAPPHN